MATQRKGKLRDDFDGPWKVYFRKSLSEFIAFVDDESYRAINWDIEPVFLDKELRRISRGLKKNSLVVDFLARVWLKDGSDRFIQIHVEFQSQKDIDLPERMFVYNTRGYDIYRTPVLSYAILADEVSDWKPDSFGYGSGKSRSFVSFNALKLKDYYGREAELEMSDNPFALALLAHIKTQQTRGEALSRFEWKIKLFRMLIVRGWKRPSVEALMHFMDWMMQLPLSLEDRFDDLIEEELEENTMELISPKEKRNRLRERTEGKEEGKDEGALSEAQLSVVDNLTARFDQISETLESKIRRIQSLETLRELRKISAKAISLSEFEKALGES